MKLTYPKKILVAWGEAISGNSEIRDWLIKNGYPELGIFVFALHLKPDARQWLVKNQFPHLLALISASEGDEKALAWLEHHGFSVFAKMAVVIHEGKEEVYEFLKSKHPFMAILCKKIELVKDQIQLENDDVHRISKE